MATINLTVIDVVLPLNISIEQIQCSHLCSEQIIWVRNTIMRVELNFALFSFVLSLNHLAGAYF